MRVQMQVQSCVVDVDDVFVDFFDGFGFDIASAIKFGTLSSIAFFEDEVGCAVGCSRTSAV